MDLKLPTTLDEALKLIHYLIAENQKLRSKVEELELRIEKLLLQIK